MSIFIKLKKIVINASTVIAHLKTWFAFNVRPLIEGDESKRVWDGSNNGNHAVLNGGFALSFNGTNTEVTVGDTNQTIKSLCFWCYLSSDTEKILDLDGGTTMIEVNAGVLTVSGFTGLTLYVNGFNDNIVTPGKWEFIAITGTADVNLSNLIIGKIGATYFNGLLAGLKFWSVSAPAASILHQYKNPERLSPPGLSLAYLVAFYPLSEAATLPIVLDHSGNHNNGQILGTFTYNLSESGILPNLPLVNLSQLLTSNGSSFVSIANDASLDNTTALTVSLWFIRSETTATNRGLYHKNPDNTGLRILCDAANLTIKGGGASSLSVPGFDEIGVLYNLIVTVTGTTATAYKNGVQVATGTIDALTSFAGSLNIGSALDDTTTRPFNGLIFSAAEWGIVLNSDQIEQLTNGNLPTTIALADLSGYWENNNVKTWPDQSTNDNIGTPTGTLETIILREGKTTGKNLLGLTLTDKWPNVGKFYGAQYAQITNNTGLNFSDPLTVAFWYKHQTPNTAQTILEKANTFKAEILADNTFQATIYHSGGTAEIINPTNELTDFYWVHFVLTFDGSVIRVYKDGFEVENLTIVANIDTDTTDIYIGADSTPANYLNGYFDEFKFLCKAWSNTEVLNEYTNTEPQHRNIEVIGGLIIGEPGNFGLGDPGSNIFLGNN